MTARWLLLLLLPPPSGAPTGGGDGDVQRQRRQGGEQVVRAAGGSPEGQVVSRVRQGGCWVRGAARFGGGDRMVDYSR